MFLPPPGQLRTWESREGRTGERLITEFDFLVAPRTGCEAPADLSAFGPRFKWMTLPDGFTLAESNASSTEVRKRAKYTYGRDLSGGESGLLALVAMDGLVPPAVLAYIVRHRLYKVSSMPCTAVHDAHATACGACERPCSMPCTVHTRPRCAHVRWPARILERTPPTPICSEPRVQGGLAEGWQRGALARSCGQDGPARCTRLEKTEWTTARHPGVVLTYVLHVPCTRMRMRIVQQGQ